MTIVNASSGSGVDPGLDPVVEDVRKRGRRLTQRFDHDPKKLFEVLQRLSEEHPEKMVGQVRVVPLSEPASGN